MNFFVRKPRPTTTPN